MNQARPKLYQSHLARETTPSAQPSVFKAFLKQPLQTGAIAASSQQLAERLAAAADISRGGTVVELGAGTGVVTEQILRLSPQDTRLISLELDRHLAVQAQMRCPQAQVHHANALELQTILNSAGLAGCDAMVSCLPWANLEVSSQNAILDVVEQVLIPGGYLTTFAYVHSKWMPKARVFYRHLQARYGDVEISDVIWANLPPAVIYRVRAPTRSSTLARL